MIIADRNYSQCFWKLFSFCLCQFHNSRQRINFNIFSNDKSILGIILQYQFKYHNFSFEVYSPLTSGIAHLRTYLDFCLGLDSRSHRYISFKFSFVCHAGWFLKGWLRKIVSNFAKLNLLLWCKHQNIICQEFVGMRCSLVRSRGILLSKYFSCGVTHLKL